MHLLTRTVAGVVTTYNVGWIPIAISLLAAAGTFGNFALNLGIHFNWW
jgi:hypothetical protein